MATPPVHVTVTGAAGQIGYALVHRVAHGDLLGPNQPIVLRLLEIEPALPALEGVVMELEDGAHQLLEGIEATADLKTAFDGASWCLLVGSVPRKKGMERRDLLTVNGGIFKPQGRAINDHADDDVRVLVVGNPANTNCLIAGQRAGHSRRSVVRDDAPRREPGQEPAGAEGGRPRAEVTNMAIWGNHSTTQFPDFVHARIGGKPAPDVIGDLDWLRGPFLETVQKRGAAVIEARGASSAASAAHAALDSVRSVVNPTPAGDWHSLAVASRGEYGIPEGLQFGFPVRSDGTAWSIVDGIEHDKWAREKIEITTNELLEERDEVQELLRA